MLSRYRASLIVTAVTTVVLNSVISNHAIGSVLESDSTQGSAYTVSSTDLIEGMTGTLTASNPKAGSEGSGPITALTDGVFGGLGVTNAPGTAAYTIGDGTVITYALGAGAFGGGFDITNINTFTAWGDSGRINQNYTVSYSTVAAPTTFIPIATVGYGPTGIGSPQATQVLLSDTTGSLANHVADIQFSFPATQNGYVGYHELDVIGHAVPEPASLALCGLGAVGLLAAAWRRRKA